jgi:hypothetical protein
MTDSSTSERWLWRSNFIEDSKDPIEDTTRLKVAQHHASQYLSKGISEYSPWFPGAAKDVADDLSRDGDRSNKELTQILCSLYPSQIPQHFKIVPLPNKITLPLTLLLLWMAIKQHSMGAHSRTKLGHVDNTQTTVNLAASETTSSSTKWHETKRSKSWELLTWL